MKMTSLRVACVAGVLLCACKAPPHRTFAGELATGAFAEVRLVTELGHEPSELLVFGGFDGKPLDDEPQALLVEPGTHEYQVLGYRDEALFGMHVLDPNRGTIRFDAVAGHLYRVYAKSRGPTLRFDIWLWVKDQATGEIVAGREP